jgi:hypothetical protein
MRLIRSSVLLLSALCGIFLLFVVQTIAQSEEIQKLETRLFELRQRYTDNHPEVMLLEKELRRAKKAAANGGRTEIERPGRAIERPRSEDSPDSGTTRGKERGARPYGLGDDVCDAGAEAPEDIARPARPDGDYPQGAYHVSTRGRGGNEGASDAPFLTITRCAEAMKAGDTCVVHQGTYRETVVLQRSGASGRPIRFVTAPGEHVVIDVTEPVKGPWILHQGSIYKAKIDSLTSQVFVDGEMAIEARWPNMTFAERWRPSSWAKSSKGSRYGKIVDADLAATNIDWTGAIATLNVAHQFFSWTRRVKKHTKGGRYSHTTRTSLV